MRGATGLTVSAGAASNKLVAKIASDFAKPDGLKAVWPGQERAFLWPQPVGRIWGVGHKTEETLRGMGIVTIEDLAKRPAAELAGRFGRLGAQLHELANGLDRRRVEPDRRLQQVSRETTFAEDQEHRERLEAVLEELAAAVAAGLADRGTQGRTVTIKVRHHDFRSAARQATLPEATAAQAVILDAGLRLFRALWEQEPGMRLRLIGIGVSNFEGEEGRQLPLPWDPAPDFGNAPAGKPNDLAPGY